MLLLSSALTSKAVGAFQTMLQNKGALTFTLFTSGVERVEDLAYFDVYRDKHGIFNVPDNTTLARWTVNADNVNTFMSDTEKGVTLDLEHMFNYLNENVGNYAGIDDFLGQSYRALSSTTNLFFAVNFTRWSTVSGRLYENAIDNDHSNVAIAGAVGRIGLGVDGASGRAPRLVTDDMTPLQWRLEGQIDFNVRSIVFTDYSESIARSELSNEQLGQLIHVRHTSAPSSAVYWGWSRKDLEVIYDYNYTTNTSPLYGCRTQVEMIGARGGRYYFEIEVPTNHIDSYRSRGSLELNPSLYLDAGDSTMSLNRRFRSGDSTPLWTRTTPTSYNLVGEKPDERLVVGVVWDVDARKIMFNRYDLGRTDFLYQSDLESRHYNETGRLSLVFRTNNQQNPVVFKLRLRSDELVRDCPQDCTPLSTAWLASDAKLATNVWELDPAWGYTDTQTSSSKECEIKGATAPSLRVQGVDIYNADRPFLTEKPTVPLFNMVDAAGSQRVHITQRDTHLPNVLAPYRQDCVITLWARVVYHYVEGRMSLFRHAADEGFHIFVERDAAYNNRHVLRFTHLNQPPVTLGAFPMDNWFMLTMNFETVGTDRVVSAYINDTLIKSYTMGLQLDTGYWTQATYGSLGTGVQHVMGKTRMLHRTNWDQAAVSAAFNADKALYYNAEVTDNVKLIVNATDTINEQLARDSSAYNHILRFNAVTKVDDSPFNTTSLKFTGTSWVQTTLTPLEDDWTVELWVKIDVNASSNAGFISSSKVGGFNGLSVSRDKVWVGDNSGIPLSWGAPIPTGEWIHLAVSGYGGVLRLFVNGVMTNSGEVPTTIINESYWLIGQRYSNNASWGLFGQVDDVRITKGQRYVEDFTPPEAL